MELSLDVPSDLEYVGPAVELIADELPGGPLSPRRIRFNFRTAFAEALANAIARSEEHTSELQSQSNLVCRLLLEKKKNTVLQTFPMTKPKISSYFLTYLYIVYC